MFKKGEFNSPFLFIARRFILRGISYRPAFVVRYK
jgi:hypothetical protein